MIILGIDPGIINVGFSVLAMQNNIVTLLDYGVFKMYSKQSIPERLNLLKNFFEEKIKEHNVTAISLETPFMGKNAQNFLKLGYVRGIIYLLVNQYNLQIKEFAPRTVKMALTGYGGAYKLQIGQVIKRLFPNFDINCKHDVTDAIGLALCCLWNEGNKVKQT